MKIHASVFTVLRSFFFRNNGEVGILMMLQQQSMTNLDFGGVFLTPMLAMTKNILKVLINGKALCCSPRKKKMFYGIWEGDRCVPFLNCSQSHNREFTYFTSIKVACGSELGLHDTELD